MTETRDVPYTETVSAVPPGVPDKLLYVRNIATDCTAGARAASMDALFDAVKVNP